MSALAYARAHRARFLGELRQLIRIPSVSAQTKHAEDVRRCGEWLAGHLKRIGMDGVRMIATPRHPLVYAEWTKLPTVLVYGHYDVQPPDPLREWTAPPFEPTVRGRHLYGRGACDDKGQLFCHVKALESFLKTDGRLPVNVKVLFEGEEEIGSPNLRPFLLRSGGSIPVVNMFQEILGIPTALMGFALPDDRIHAPNERFFLPNFERGIATCLAFLDEMSTARLAGRREEARAAAEVEP